MKDKLGGEEEEEKPMTRGMGMHKK
jgi:hypothetical protein